MKGITFSKPRTELDGAIMHLKALKSIASDADARYKAQQARVIDILDQMGQKTAKSGDVKVNRVSRTVTTIDEKGLAKALGAAMYNKITKKTLDKSKLEDKIERGEIDLNVVAQYTQVSETQPYIRLSHILEGEDNDE